MARKTRSANRKSTQPAAEPTASRPFFPKGYGVPKDSKGLLPWRHVAARMSRAKHFWVCTVAPDGRPHATPVDALWIEDRLYFGGSPQTRRNRNLVANPAVVVHLENAMDVVIIHGEAKELREPADRALGARLAEASKKKYGYSPKPEEFFKGGSFEVRPRVVYAWKTLKDATRWRFPEW